MGGIRCKVIIDYSNYAAEATALASLAGDPKHGFGKLAAEAAASAKAAYGGWVAGLEAIEYDTANGPIVLAQSQKVCEWAKALRTWCDVLDGSGDKGHRYERPQPMDRDDAPLAR